MIQFIELVPVEVENENWEQEQEEFLNSREFGAVPPQKTFLRHNNKLIQEYIGEYIPFVVGELISIYNQNYKVEFIGPKEFEDMFVQKIYIQKMP